MKRCVQSFCRNRRASGRNDGLCAVCGSAKDQYPTPPLATPSRRVELTDRQREVLAYVGTHAREHLLAPTLREIGNALHISVPTVHAHVVALRRKGFLSWREGQPRTMQVVKR